MKKRKALGQHFLADRHVLNKIVKTINPQKDDLIIEVGAGKGALTFPLAARAQKVIAIERDRSLIPTLQRKKITSLIIIQADILKVDFKKLIESEKSGACQVKLVGNLPYSISSPLLFKLLPERRLFTECVFLLQKEVAQRIDANPGSKKYAPLSILFQIYFSTTIHDIIPPDAFAPPPQVESALISLVRRRHPLFTIQDDLLFMKFLKGAFRHRRKILHNNLERLGFSTSLIDKAYHTLGIEKEKRAEQLPIAQFIDLYGFLSSETNPEGKNPKTRAL